MRQRRVQAAGGKGRRLVADDGGAAPALGLGGFADVVGNVGVGHGDVAQRQQGRVVHGQAALLARQPFLRAVGAKVDERIGPLARPQIGGEVVVRGQGGGGVVDGFFLAHLPVGARRLRQDEHLAQLQARDDEKVLPAPAHHHARLCRVTPGLMQRGLRGLGQLREPRAVVGQRQQLGQIGLQQGLQAACAVGRGQQVLQLRDQRVFLRRGGVVTGGLHAVQHVAQAARHVQERGGEVFLPRRVVPEHHRHLLVGVGRALQFGQAHGLVHHGLGLRGDGNDLLIAFARGGGHLDVGHARVFGLGQVEGHVHQRHAVRVFFPVGRLAAPVGHGLQHGHAQGGKLGAPVFGVEHDLRGDQHIHQRAARRVLQQAGEAFGLHHGRVERQGDGAAGLDAFDQVVDKRRLDGGDVLLVQRQPNDGRALAARRGRVHALPGEILLRGGKHLLRCFGVVNRRFGVEHRISHRWRRLAAQVGA